MDSLNLQFAGSAGVPPAQKNKCRMGFLKGQFLLLVQPGMPPLAAFCRRYAGAPGKPQTKNANAEVLDFEN
jgi:hypothetical protein